MIIPIAHEDQRGRRWPYVTIAIIALNVVVFLFTHTKMEAEQHQAGEVQFHILALGARYPDLQLPPEATDMVEAFKREHARLYGTLATPNRRPYDAWDAQLLSGNWTAADLDAQVETLTTQLDQIHQQSLAWNYAFHPYHPTAISYISANFLHGGWLHLIFNMWFLWLAGTVLEDAWGRVVYPIFYLVCGMLALAFHAGVFRGSFMPVVGASGAIAGLMGGFLARFPENKDQAGLAVPVSHLQVFCARLHHPAVVAGIPSLLGRAGGSRGRRGLLGARRRFRIWRDHCRSLARHRHRANHGSSDRGKGHLDGRRTPRAGDRTAWRKPGRGSRGHARTTCEGQPDSIDGHMLLLKAQERRSDPAGQKETLANLCRLYLSEGDPDAAWNYYEHFAALGGDKLPRGVWLELCRYLERNQNGERAVTEYERFAEKNSTERASVPALAAAARICLTKLHRAADAERFYRAAALSPVPHLDLEGEIEEGLKKCVAAAPASGSYGGGR